MPPADDLGFVHTFVPGTAGVLVIKFPWESSSWMVKVYVPGLVIAIW